jgi:hypothetical protein
MHVTSVCNAKEGVMHGLDNRVLERNDSIEGLVDRIGLLEHLGLKLKVGLGRGMKLGILIDGAKAWMTNILRWWVKVWTGNILGSKNKSIYKNVKKI